ncbi:MAG: Verru_Chthon cassette protein B [Chthoniobacteraceae bacterium]
MMNLESPRTNGFTLIEVSFALGLIVFGLLAMIGVLPTGLGALRSSTQQTMDAQILQQVSSQLSAQTFGNRTDFTNFSGPVKLYFDSEGQMLTSSSSARYLATVSGQQPSLPGLSAGANQTLSGSLKLIGVSIARVDIPNATTNVYSLQIAYH